MQFRHLQSLVVSGKVSFTPKAGAPLSQVSPRTAPYIEPTLGKEKDFYPSEKPSVILISAVGATGKSALAQVLAGSANMPLLDLSRHKAVGDNTISGLLTNSYEAKDLGSVFGGLKDGTFGIVIDGLDEGRSKTTEQGFEAFLDDIANLCDGAPRPTFILLGRSDIVDSTWLHFAEKKLTVGLLTIAPFDRAQAHAYIDKISHVDGTAFTTQYEGARDAILNCLAAAFSDSAPANEPDSFLSFIGYPPVLDAVATVLKEERNFFRLENEISATVSGDREIELLTKICAFVLEREQRDKVWPNILAGLCANVTAETLQRIKAFGFAQEEQCARLLAYCLGTRMDISVFHDEVLDLRFEEQLGSFFIDHPFITGKRFRNAVFEAYALAMAFYSENTNFQALAIDYISRFRSTYHLVYMCAKVSEGRAFPLLHVRALIAAALDFRSRTSDVFLEIDGGGSSYDLESPPSGVQVDISVLAGSADEGGLPIAPRTFKFTGNSPDNSPIDLGGTLANALIYIPRKVVLRSKTEIKLIAPLSLLCSELALDAPSMSISVTPGAVESNVMFDTGIITSTLQTVSLAGTKLEIFTNDPQGFGYPIVSHIKRIPDDAFDPDSKAKYLRLRKILTQFRSHSKGQLAKYRDKVENERVAGNQIGVAILDQLLKDGVLSNDTKFYYIEPSRLHECLGVNWTDLRSGVVNDKLVTYLRAIRVDV